METITFEINGEAKTAKIRENVPFAQLLEAIDDGVSLCHDEEGTLCPEMIDFAIEYVCLDTLTDIKMSPKANTAWKYIRAIDGVPTAEADFIADGIRARIEYNTKMITASMQSLGMHDLMMRIDRIANTIEDTTKAGKKLIETLLTDAEKNANVDLQSVVDAVKSGDFTEHKVAAAVLDYQAAKKQIQAERQAQIKKATAKKSTNKKVQEPVKE